MNDNDTSSLFPEDKPWPTSVFNRKHPGIGVPGRTWSDISCQDLKMIMGDILKDSDSVVATVDIDINMDTGKISVAKLHSLNDSIIPIVAEHQDGFNDFIDVSVKSNLSTLRVNIHNTGWFW